MPTSSAFVPFRLSLLSQVSLSSPTAGSMERYYDKFIEEGADSMLALEMLTDADLQTYGVKLMHRRLILRGVSNFSATLEPSSERLQTKIYEILEAADFDPQKATASDVRKKLEEHFGCSLNKRKEEVRNLLLQCMSSASSFSLYPPCAANSHCRRAWPLR